MAVEWLRAPPARVAAPDSRRSGVTPRAVYRFLLQRHPELDGKTALDALREGQIDAVMARAENVGESVFA